MMKVSNPNIPFKRAFRSMVDSYKKNNPGTTNEDLAERLKMSTGAISDFYNGKNTNPTLAVLIKLHDFFNVSYAYLAGETPIGDNDSFALLESEIGKIKANAMIYDRTYIVDEVIKDIERLFDYSVAGYVIPGMQELWSKLSFSDGALTIAGIDGLESIVSAILKTRDAAVNITAKQVDAAALISSIELNMSNLREELSEKLMDISINRDIYSELDSAVAAFKQDMNDAIIKEVRRLNEQICEQKEGEVNGADN